MRRGRRGLAGVSKTGPGPARAFIGLGSNIDPTRNVFSALEILSQEPGIDLRGISTIYRTRALPPPGLPDGSATAEPDYLNGVLELHTTLEPETLSLRLFEVEKALGRARTQDKHAPRTMDLDLLLYLPSDREPGDGDGLPGSAGDPGVKSRPLPGWGPGTPPTALHPDVRTRPFVAIPLLELAPDLRLPPDGVPLRTVVASLHGALEQPDVGLTRKLRARFLKS
jgi:2-amino-4-hydroxy-6-hydroxymethyldihydropteridine diphosphokinase